MRRSIVLFWFAPIISAVVLATPLSGLNALLAQDDDADAIVFDLTHTHPARTVPDAILDTAAGTANRLVVALFVVALAILTTLLSRGSARPFRTDSRGPPGAVWTLCTTH